MIKFYRPNKIIAFFCLVGLLTFIPAKPGCTAQTTGTEPGSITVTGRVLIEQRGTTPLLILHGTDAAAYLIQGGLAGQLRHIAQKKPEINLVTVTGIAGGTSSVTCNRTSTPVTTKTGVKEFQTEVRCIRYMHLDVRAIVSVAEAAAPMPPLRRDEAAESKMRSSGTPVVQIPRPPMIGVIYGTITACNLRSAIQTIDIQNIDPNNALKSVTVLVTDATRIAKRIGSAEPVVLAPESLQVGQRVTVSYSRSELRTNAMFITVTKE